MVSRYYLWMCSVWVGRKPPGFAFIEFEDRRDADDAIRALNGICAAFKFLDLLYVCNVLMIGSPLFYACCLLIRSLDPGV